jgi:hypothetical protein
LLAVPVGEQANEAYSILNGINGRHVVRCAGQEIEVGLRGHRFSHSGQGNRAEGLGSGGLAGRNSISHDGAYGEGGERREKPITMTGDQAPPVESLVTPCVVLCFPIDQGQDVPAQRFAQRPQRSQL